MLYSTNTNSTLTIFLHPSVVAGVMNTNELFPFMLKKTKLLSEIDSIKDIGTYSIQGTSSSPWEVDYGLMVVYPVAFGNGVIQTLYTLNTKVVVQRTFLNDSWSSWQRLDNFGYNSLSELASGVSANKTVNKKPSFAAGTHNLIQMDYGFAVIVFNTATIYLTVSNNGTFSKTIEGTLNENITSIDYADGYVTIKVGSAVQLGTIIYAPHGTILI